MNFHDKVRDRLIRYAKIDTQSSNTSKTVPTTARQFDLARVLTDELKSIGASDLPTCRKRRNIRPRRVRHPPAPIPSVW